MKSCVFCGLPAFKHAELPTCPDGGVHHVEDVVAYCPAHDEVLDDHAKCRECYAADAEYAEAERDIRHLWNQR